MADFARRAGVSTATVSHVLNNTRAVSEDTRAAVLAAVDETEYTPNTVARSLATSRTTTLGLVLSAISTPYFAELLSAAERAAAAAGYTLLLVDPHEDPHYERTVVAPPHPPPVARGALPPPAAPPPSPGCPPPASPPSSSPGPPPPTRRWSTSPAGRSRRCCWTG